MRATSISLPLALTLAGRALAYPHDKPLLHVDKALSFRAQAVEEAFLHAWNGYVEYAFPHDELHPVSNGYGDSRYLRHPFGAPTQEHTDLRS